MDIPSLSKVSKEKVFQVLRKPVLEYCVSRPAHELCLKRDIVERDGVCAGSFICYDVVQLSTSRTGSTGRTGTVYIDGNETGCMFP